MKICREMVDAMGGFDSEMYRRFRTLACEAYNLLRKHSKLLLSLCHLMAGAAIPDMHADPEKALLKVQASPAAGTSRCCCSCGWSSSDIRQTECECLLMSVGLGTSAAAAAAANGRSLMVAI